VKYYARIGQNEYEVEIENDTVAINGEIVEVDLCHSYDMLIQPQRFSYNITFRSEQFQVQVEDERTRKLNTGRKAPALPHGELAIRAPIPGLVVKVLVNPDDEVADGQSLVILEAMKMENEIRALRAGKVRSVAVTPGQRVEQNEVLLVVD
jgi:biotin carboxyl carrier protein